MTPNTQLDESRIKEQLQDARRMKQALKQLSKNQLISLLIEQVNQTIEQQNINRILLDQIKAQKAEPAND